MRAVIIFAAGQGTRMKSDLPKVLHPLCNKSMVDYVIDLAKSLNPSQIILVASPQLLIYLTENQGVLKNPLDDLTLTIQAEALGTGHAMQVAHKSLNPDVSEVIVLYGDVPLVQKETLTPLLKSKAPLSMLGMRIKPPHAYGRMIVDQKNVQRIVEAKDATPEEKKIELCWTGILKADKAFLDQTLFLLTPSAVTKEYYLTQLVEIACEKTLHVSSIEAQEIEEFEGANNQEDLAKLEKRFQNRIRKAMMEKGVKLIDPENVYFSYDTSVEANTTIYPFVTFGTKVSISSHCQVFSFCHIENSMLEKGVSVGPFAHLRGGNFLKEGSSIGNFVEVKKSTIGEKSKAKHLAYIGDATLGTKVNIGAGTITANYDGKNKFKTTIGDNVMVGSNSTLIAPITLENSVYVAAGSVITKDVPENTLVFGRARQVHKPKKTTEG